ncbi:MAG: type II toxin-antitoxin system VapC family toxin [Promethearchaeota archaeon]
MRLFVDTSGFKAFYDNSDRHHSRATKFIQELRERRLPYTFVFTSDYIFDETVTLIRMAHSHANAVKFGEAVLASRIINLVKLDDEVVHAAWILFKKYHDKAFSFTDCTSFALMKQMGVQDAFAFDKNFEQAGFRMLP